MLLLKDMSMFEQFSATIPYCDVAELTVTEDMSGVYASMGTPTDKMTEINPQYEEITVIVSPFSPTARMEAVTTIIGENYLRNCVLCPVSSRCDKRARFDSAS